MIRILAYVLLCLVVGTALGTEDNLFIRGDKRNELPSSDSGSLFNVTTGDIVDCSTYCFNHHNCHTFFFVTDSLTCLGYTVSTMYSANLIVQPNSVRFSIFQNDCTSSGYTLLTKVLMCIKLQTTLRTWSHARQKCEEEGADLAIVDTDEKITLMAEYIRSRHVFNRWYVGLVEGDKDGSWAWINNQSLSTSVKTTFVHTTARNCGVLHVGGEKFLDLDCNTSKRSICQKRLT